MKIKIMIIFLGSFDLKNPVSYVDITTNTGSAWVKPEAMSLTCNNYSTASSTTHNYYTCSAMTDTDTSSIIFAILFKN